MDIVMSIGVNKQYKLYSVWITIHQSDNMNRYKTEYMDLIHNLFRLNVISMENSTK